MHWRFWEPKHTVKSVAQRLAAGLRDGSVVLDDPLDDEPADLKAEIFFERGMERYRKGDFSGALGYFVKILTLDEVQAEWKLAALAKSCNAKISLGDWEGARQDAGLILKMSDATPSDRAMALVNRGAAWIALGNHAEAERDYTQSLDNLLAIGASDPQAASTLATDIAQRNAEIADRLRANAGIAADAGSAKGTTLPKANPISPAEHPAKLPGSI
jgi:tetratricopeptide (TPR) repeat protein